jgi:anhydro-N-acetylmuramic acid kinase
MAIGAHGQTVRHRPRDFGPHGYTLQLMNGARLAELSGIDVVCDFRSRDVAAGGEGAPLVPAFHAARFSQAGHSRAVLNLGGIANLTLLDQDGSVRGHDTGPGNVLMDLWCQRHLQLPYDAGGAWAASGRVVPGLLADLLNEPFLQRVPPKSTGRDLFDATWLDARLLGNKAIAVDVMATLTELTARSVCDALVREAPGLQSLIVCGGGAHNAHLVDRLGQLLGSHVAVSSSASAGMPPDQVEALAFAWLARAFIARQPGNLPAVTGACARRVLGALYPA